MFVISTAPFSFEIIYELHVYHYMLQFQFYNLVTSKPEEGGRQQGCLVVSAFDSGASDPRSSPGQGHCVVFLGKTHHSRSASLHPGV